MLQFLRVSLSVSVYLMSLVERPQRFTIGIPSCSRRGGWGDSAVGGVRQSMSSVRVNRTTKIGYQAAINMRNGPLKSDRLWPTTAGVYLTWL